MFISQFAFLFFAATFSFDPIRKIVCEHSIQNISATKSDLSTQQKYIPTDCKITDIDWFNHEKNLEIISNIIESKIEQEIEIDENNRPYHYYRINLFTKTGNIPFTDKRFTESELKKIQLLVSSINEFIVTNENVEIARIVDNRDLGYITFGCGLFFATIIFLSMLTGLYVSFCFDKESNLFTVSRYRCFGIFGKKEFQYPLNEIVDVKVERISVSWDEDVSQVVLVLSDNEFYLNPISMISKNIDGAYIVMIIKDFLK
ncbi:hypothetical protein NIES267_05200 [Calothrix parasitica NIES-267]|uniref:Uncharacterized protein n=1 Tax=Calothrix parasitica NIES-267 TaxID=1973488 RepID=A0A1Z4LIJ0_9CYAN|nr:hypothetical protein NIES267_05200 [Calothrix parasitica NIES-267]